MKYDTEQTMKLEQPYKIGYEFKLNTWPDSSMGQTDGKEFSGCGLKSHFGQFSIDTLNNP